MSETKNIKNIYQKFYNVKLLSEYLEIYSKNLNTGIRKLNQHVINHFKNGGDEHYKLVIL